MAPGGFGVQGSSPAENFFFADCIRKTSSPPPLKPVEFSSILRQEEIESVSPEREMLDGVGHGEKRFDRRTYIADWFMKQLGAG